MPQRFLKLSQSGSVNIVELILPPSLDHAEFDDLNHAIFQKIDAEPGSSWVLDLAQTSYMGSAMLGLMVNIRQRIRQAQGKLVICSLSPRLTEVFRTCSLERLFIIAPSRAEALRGLGGT